MLVECMLQLCQVLQTNAVGIKRFVLDSKMNFPIEDKLKKAKKEKDYTRRLLQDCKRWKEPGTTEKLQYPER